MSDKYSGATTGKGKKKRWIKTPEFAAFCSLLQACKNVNNPRYYLFGAKGVSVDSSFEEILADIGYRPSEHHVLGRIDSKGNFAVGNVAWLTRPERRSKGTAHKPAKRCICHPERKHYGLSLCVTCFKREAWRHMTKKQKRARTKWSNDRWKAIKKSPVKHAAYKKYRRDLYAANQKKEK
jgi:hypothetical protein